MYINPKLAIDSGWVTGVRNEDLQVQPNAIDFTLDKLYSINHAPFFINEDNKQMRGGFPVTPAPVNNGNEERDYWKLLPRSVYDGMSDMYVELPEGVAAHLIIRSTLNRNGLFITSGLYDSFFRGNIGFCLHNRGDAAFIEPGTRVGQIIFVESDSAGKYTGGYNTQSGQHWSEST